jgi:hypothetical protein
VSYDFCTLFPSKVAEGLLFPSHLCQAFKCAYGDRLALSYEGGGLCDLQFETFAPQLKWTVQNDGFELYCNADYVSQKIPEPWQFNYIALAHEFRLCKYAFDLQHFSFGLQLSSSSLLVIIFGLRGIGIDFQFNPFALQLDWTCQNDGFEVC